jgi:hypothetical protein
VLGAKRAEALDRLDARAGAPGDGRDQAKLLSP